MSFAPLEVPLDEVRTIVQGRNFEKQSLVEWAAGPVTPSLSGFCSGSGPSDISELRTGGSWYARELKGAREARGE